MAQTDRRVQAPPSRRPVVTVAIAAALGGFLFGYDTAVINGAVDAVQGEFRLAHAVIGLVVTSASLGCAIGAWFTGQIAGRYGRVRVMILAANTFALNAIGSSLTVGPWDLTAWRMDGGLPVGAPSVITLAYIAEISP